MNDTLLISLGFLIIGLVLGGALGWQMARIKGASPSIPDALFVPRAALDLLKEQHTTLQKQLDETELELRQLHADLAARNQSILYLDEQLAEHKNNQTKVQERLQLEFEKLAGQLLEEKSRRFATQNQEQLQSILSPLREHIQVFERGINERFLEETRDRVSLKKEIEQLRHLNQQLSQDAHNLVNALKGNSKTQGDWGELQLELLLQKAGLEKGFSYDMQTSFSGEDGRQKRPDFIIRLPDDKHLIIDSKVSLTAYERYCSAQDPSEQETALREHVDSLRKHIKGLGEKKYEQLYQIHTPDYLLLFVPLEPAFSVALQQDQKLFTDALDRNIVLVSTSTLLATMRTVSFIWKQEKQKQSVQEIARQSGLLYDRFCTFVEDLKSIGLRLDQAQRSYRDAFDKLRDGGKYGDTLIGRAERIRELGARNSRMLPADLLDIPEPPEIGSPLNADE